jgi:hypothetical protein
MKPYLYRVRLAVTALALLGITVSAGAQQPRQDLVPFKATLTGAILPDFTIPTDPPISYDNQTATGQASEIGQVTYYEHVAAHLGVNDSLAYFSDGVGALVAANGDALFIKFGGLLGPTGAQWGYTVTGGRGRFAGATGSGTLLCVRNPQKKELVRTFEGMISRPKP